MPEPIFFTLDETKQITTNFHMDELACKGRERYKHVHIYYQENVDRLQWIRDQIGVPIHINSAYRCEKHNKKIGGAKYSQHLQGKAYDIRADRISPFHLAFLTGHAGFKGIIIYDNFVHVDSRDDYYFEDRRK